MSKASLEGSTGVTEMCIPLIELLDEEAGLAPTADAQDLVLRVKIETSWDEHPLEQEEFIAKFDESEEGEEESETIATARPNSRKKSPGDGH